MIAAIAEDGREVNVGLPALAAVAFLERAAWLVASMGNAPVRETKQ